MVVYTPGYTPQGGIYREDTLGTPLREAYTGRFTLGIPSGRHIQGGLPLGIPLREAYTRVKRRSLGTLKTVIPG